LEILLAIMVIVLAIPPAGKRSDFDGARIGMHPGKAADDSFKHRIVGSHPWASGAAASQVARESAKWSAMLLPTKKQNRLQVSP